MVGRPKRTSDPELQKALDAALERSGLTASGLARRLGRSPSTLLRSHGIGKYSRELAAQLHGLIRNGWPSTSLDEAMTVSEYPNRDLQKFLECLQEMRDILPNLTAALESVLDQRRQPL